MNMEYAVLFFLRMDRGCLGLHEFKNMRCEVITIQNYCYALLCPVRHFYRLIMLLVQE